MESIAGNQAARVPRDVARVLRVLVVEDEKRVATALRDGLEGEGYEVVTEATGEDALFRGSTEVFDLILLDLGLPGRDGIEVVSALRQKGVHTPVLILTARDGVTNRVRGLSAGADDYLAKPFAFSELLARISAILRRGRVLAAGPLSVGPLRLDPATRQVRCAGNEITLTAKEFELVEYLARAGGRVVSRDALARDVWKETARSTTLDNVIDVHISRVRRKLGSPVLLHTVRGVGFTLREGTA